MIKFFRKAVLTLTFLPAVALSQGALENPASLTTESGVGIISGWHCTAREVEALVDNVSVGYTYVGSDRSDTKTVCNGVSATGFALLTNFNVFTPGLHNLKVLADGKQFGEVNFTTVKSGGVEYLTDVSKQAVITDFPKAGSTATLNWNQSKQSFVVTAVSNSASPQDNTAPVANAGVAQTVVVGTTVTLNGSASSDANGDPLTYVWTLTKVPTGSRNSVSSVASVEATFTADVAGLFVASLTVSDGKVHSTPVTVTITATAYPVVQQQCYQSSISSPSPFMGNSDEIFKLTDGTYWQVKYSYEYLYEYNPSVVICPADGIVYVKNKTIDIISLHSVVESQVNGASNGWDGETIVELTNGQIWKQSSYYYHYHYSYRPNVIIYNDGGYKMVIEGIDKSVSVTRLR